MKITLVAIVLVLISANALALVPCGNSRSEKDKQHLVWIEVGDFRVNTTFANVRGLICAGVTKDFTRIEFLNYRDTRGGDVIAPLTRLQRSDVAFIRESSFPAVARWLTRSDHPLTLKVNKVTIQNGNSIYDISLKFLRNVRSSRYASDLRDIRTLVELKHYSKELSATHQGNLFDGVILGVSAGLSVATVTLMEGDRKVSILNPYDLPTTTRN